MTEGHDNDNKPQDFSIKKKDSRLYNYTHSHTHTPTPTPTHICSYYAVTLQKLTYAL